MPADTYTSRLGLIIQGTGNNNNTWGDTFNNSFGAIIERAVAGRVVHTDTGGTLDLSTSPPPAGPTAALDFIQAFTGALASNLTVQMPNLSKSWMIDNSTSGAFQLFIRNGAAGGVVQVPQGTVRMVICDGAGGMKREDGDHVGSIRHSATAVDPPAGGLSCNGASLLRSDYPDLFAKIGTLWGSVDGTHFTLPDFNTTNRFLRASRPGILGVGNYQSNTVGAHSHPVTGAPSVGTLGTDNPGNHTHANSLTDLTHTHVIPLLQRSGQQVSTGNGSAGEGIVPNNQPTGVNSGAPMSITNAAAGGHTHTITGAPGIGSLGTASTGGTETRPEAAVVSMNILY